LDLTRLARLAAQATDDKKAKNVTILHIGAVSTMADYFVIATGTSTTHVRAIADNVEKMLAPELKLHHAEGYQAGRWILLDFGDLVVHVFHEEERAFYNLERLWGDAPVLNAQVAG
jgi:ribosome-associated protein